MPTKTNDPTEAIRLLTTALMDARGPRDGVALLQELLSSEAPTAADGCPAMGCCGCGTWIADVLTRPTSGAPRGEMYCWSCHDRKPTIRALVARVLPGRERPVPDGAPA